ncbi:antitermination protein Q [Aeromonas hydrophila]
MNDPVLDSKASIRAPLHTVIRSSSQRLSVHRSSAGGAIRDLELSRLHGKAVDKVCPRCGGTGLRPIPGTQVRRTIEPLPVSLSRGEWERQWNPLYQAVLSWCHL